MKAKILSLYDGMACGMIAMLNAGVEIESYDAYEIDKYAIQTATHNFPIIKEHGDAITADYSQYEGVDFVIGGSPCTYWSIAQSPDKRETTASGMGWELFSHYVRAVKEAKPKYFIYENNYSMSKAIRESITDTFGFEPVLINSALVSAQNRKRLYWVGIRNERGEYERADVQQPDDRQILLKDILEHGLAFQEKSYTYTTRCQAATPEHTIKKHIHTMVAEPIRIPPYGNTNKSRVVEASYPNHAGTGEGSLKQRMFSDNPNKQQVDLIAEPINATSDEKSQTLKTQYIYEVKDGQITVKGKQYPIKLKDGYYIIRKLTVAECKRLQTVPDWYEFPVSNTQAYKMLGNGWTCDVITHLIRSCIS